MGQSTGGSSGEPGPSPHVHWFSMNFGPELALGGSALRQEDGSWLTVGSWLLRGDKKIELRNIYVESSYKTGTVLQESVVLTATTAEGEDIHITGQMINMCPTKVPAPGGAIFINEGLARYQWGDKTGYGISEQWHVVSLATTRE